MRVHLDSADSLCRPIVTIRDGGVLAPRPGNAKTSVLRLCSTLLSTAPVSQALTGGLDTSWSVPSHRGEA